MTQKANEAVNPNLFNFAETIGESVESKLKFKPRPELDNLCRGFLIKAEVIMNEAKLVDENGIQSTWEYAGFMVPTLHLEFAQEPTKEDPNERFYDMYIRAFTNITKKNEEIARDKIIEHYQNEYMILRHIANAFKTAKNYDPKAAPIQFDFLNTNIKERLESITAYFESWVKIFNGVDGTGFSRFPLTMKLIASSTGTYLTFPSYVREGFIEKFTEGRRPTIELKPGESVALVKADKKKSSQTSDGGPAATTTAPVNQEVEDMLKKYQG